MATKPENSGYKVEPKPARPLTEEEKGKVKAEFPLMYLFLYFLVGWLVIGALGAAFMHAAAVVTGSQPDQIEEEYTPLLAVACLLVMFPYLAWVISFLRGQAESQRQQKIADLQYERERGPSEEASRLLKTTQARLERAAKTLRALSMRVRLIKEDIELAKHEFQQRAYSPFWDAVERAVDSISDFKRDIDSLTSTVVSYRRNLKGFKHNFPKSPIDMSRIPNADPLLDELRAVVRLGQTDHEFASIWELRNTRKKLVQELSLLGGGVDDFHMTLQHSVGELEKTLDTRTGEILREMREAQDPRTK